MNLAICLIKQNNWKKAWSNLNEASKLQSNLNNKNKDQALKTSKKAHYWLAKYYLY